jgi:hypothetical protein
MRCRSGCARGAPQEGQGDDTAAASKESGIGIGVDQPRPVAVAPDVRDGAGPGATNLIDD